MKIQRATKKFTQEQIKVLSDFSIPRDLASMMTGLPERDVSDYRFRLKYRDSIAAASRRYREQRKFKDAERLGGRVYNFWTEEDIEYILNGTDTDEEMAEKLGRTVYSIQKKRERELNKERNR
jgi:hypothetical protein